MKNKLDANDGIKHYGTFEKIIKRSLELFISYPFCIRVN